MKPSVHHLLIFIPLALFLRWYGANSILVFIAAAVAVVPLARIVGEATETLASHLGAATGGLLNASMGNAPEIIIAIFALRNGLSTVVKASITGSILGNLLLTLGLVMVAGGLRSKTLRFNAQAASLRTSLLILAVIGVTIPSVFHFSSPNAARGISQDIALILIVVYVLNLVFVLVTNKELFLDPAAHGEKRMEGGTGSWKKAVGLLGLAAVLLALVSEILTDSLEPAAELLNLNPTFAGIIPLAVVGNLSEMLNAVAFARKGKIDLAVSSVVGSATQVALLVAPILLFAGLLMGQSMDLIFSRMEVFAVAVAVLVARTVMVDGESHWLEGIMLIGVYLMLALGFFYLE
jgi:Ca2+:H+ antiporter